MSQIEFENGIQMSIDTSDKSIEDYCKKQKLPICFKHGDKIIRPNHSRDKNTYIVAGIGNYPSPEVGEKLWFCREHTDVIGFFSLLKHMLEAGEFKVVN